MLNSGSAALVDHHGGFSTGCPLVYHWFTTCLCLHSRVLAQVSPSLVYHWFTTGLPLIDQSLVDLCLVTWGNTGYLLLKRSVCACSPLSPLADHLALESFSA